MPEVHAPLVCPACNSRNVTADDVPRKSVFASNLMVTPYRCECGKVFFIIRTDLPPPKSSNEPPRAD